MTFALIIYGIKSKGYRAKPEGVIITREKEQE